MISDGKGKGFGSWIDRELTSFYVDTVDGRKIPCVYVDNGYDGGLSCDWSPNLSEVPGGRDGDADPARASGQQYS